MNEEINPLTGLPFNDNSSSNPITDPKNVNPMTGQPLNVDELPSGISGSTLTPKIHEQVRLLGDEASYLRTNPEVDLAIAQGRGEELMRGAKGFGQNLVAGFSDALGVTFDPNLGLNIVGGVDEHYDQAATNFFTRFAESLRNDQSTQIYQKQGNDSFNPADSGWWAEMFKQSGTSVGIMLEALAETAAVTYATQGLGTVIEIPNIIRKAALIPKLTKAQKLKKNALIWAGFRRYSESLIEAKDNGLQTYRDYIKQGKSDAEASQAASQVSQNTFVGNMPLLAFDLITAGAMTSYSPVTGSAKLNKLFNVTKNKTLNKGINVLTGAVSEGSEEFWQELVNEESRYRVDRDNGLIQPNDLRFNEYAKSGKAWNAFASGVFGSAVLGGISKGLDKLSETEATRLAQQSQKEFLNSLTGSGIEITKEINSLQELGEEDKANVLRRKLGVNKALMATHLDELNGNTTASEGYIEYLQTVLDAANSNNEEELAELGLEDISFIQENFPKFIEDANKIKAIYDSEKQNNSTDNLPYIVDSQFTLEVLNERKNEIETQLSQDNVYSSEYNNLSSVGKQKLDLEVAKKSIQNEIANLSEKNNSLSGSKWFETRALIEAYKNKLTNVIEEIKNLDSSELTQEQKLQDSKILDSINFQKKEQLQSEVESINSAQTLIRERLSDLRNPELQKKAKTSKVNTTINESKSSDELKSIKAELEKDQELEPGTEELLNDKIEEAEVKEITQDYIPVETDTAIGEPSISPERKTKAQEFEDIVFEDPDNAIVVVQDEELFEPLEISNLDNNKRERLKNSVKEYYESLKTDLNKTPTFEDFVRDYIDHSTKDNADRLYNVLSEGWKDNNYAETNFDQVYNNIFRDRNEIGKFITDVGNEIISPITTNEELQASNNEELKTSVEKKSPIIGIDQNNRPTVKDTNPFRASDSKLRAAHLSIAYSTTQLVDEEGNKQIITQDISDDLNTSDNIQSIKLLNPDKYNAGEKLSVRIPDNYKDIRIQSWVDASTKGKVMSFNDWMQENNVEVGDEAYWSKVPMIAYDLDNDPVFYIHDVEWYNFINVGLKDDPQKQEQVILEARENVLNFRKSLTDTDVVNIEITEKRPGTWKTIPKDQPAITLNDANPETQLAIADSNGDLYVNGNQIFEKGNVSLINDKLFKPGYTYEIRKVSKNEYIALNVLRPKIDEATVNTLKKAIRVYSLQYDVNSDVTDIQELNKIRDRVISSTGYDLFNRKDFEDFLNLYVYTIQRPFSSNQEIVNYVNSRDDLESGTPFMVIQKGTLVFGVKGSNIDGDRNFLFLNPNLAKGDNPKSMLSNMVSILSKLDNVLPSMNVNVSKNGLTDNNQLINISEDGSIIPVKEYREFLKDSLKTNVKSYNIGSQDSPIYATIVQPVINFKKVGETETQQIEEAQEPDSVVTDDTKVLEDSLAALRSMGVPDSDPSIKILKEKLGITQELYEPVEIEQELVDSINEDSPLSIIQEFNLVDYVFNEVSKQIGFDYKSFRNKGELLGSIKKSYFDLVEPKRESNVKTLEGLKSLFAANPELNKNLEVVINKFEEELQIYNTIKDNWSTIEEKALEKIFKYTGITETQGLNEDFVIEDDTYIEKNYSKTSLEENGKSTSSYRLKRFFSGINDIKPNGEQKTGFLGVPSYVGFDKVYSTVEQVLSSPYEMPSDFESMMLRLEDNIDNQKWLPQLINKLREADDQIKNEFVYNFTRHTLSMKFVMFSKDRSGKYTAKVYDTNGNEVTKVIRRQWDSNLKTKELVFVQDGNYKINKVKAQALLNTFNEWQAEITSKSSRKKQQPITISDKEIKSWLSEFGIELSNETISELRNRKIDYITNDGKKTITFNQMFNKSPNSAGIFGLLANYLERIVQKEDTSFEDNPDNHPFDNANNVLKTIARIESKYSLYATTNSFRDGNKSIYGFTPTKHATDVVNDLKFNEEFRNQLSEKSYNGKSYLLNILNSNESFRDKFYVDHLGITSIKELGKKVFGDNSVTSLSDSDQEYLRLSMFQDTEQGEVNFKVGDNNGIDTRMARMFFPTMSDKSQMLTLYTAVLDLKNKHFNEVNEEITVKEETLDFVYSQIVQPEVDRIYNFLTNIKETNIKGYDFAAQMFINIPEINNIIDEETGKRILSLMINSPDTYNKEWFETKVRPKVNLILQDQLKEKVDQKVEQWINNGFIDEDYSNKLLNSKYFDSARIKGSNKVKAQLAAYDYVINSQVTNSNIFMLFAGDPALYSQNKIKGYFENGKPYMPKDENTYSKVVKDIIGTNIGKRLALMLAPGLKLANSQGQTYTQVFLNDYIDMSPNISKLVELFYNKDEAIKANSLIRDYQKADNEQSKQTIIKSLMKSYPEVADYFEIEATDAQEYTTLNEHIEVLWGQGRLSSENYNTFKNKALTGEEFDANELQLILQPIKPVYTGFKNEESLDTMRMVYVKSSSFPLIPQVTKGTELDGLRELLEKFEQEKGKTVRASYDTANKVGSIKNPINPFNGDGTFNTDLTLKDLEYSSLTLNRDNFRIQQDVPYKSSDTVSIGTQTLKLLFGDGITELKGFTLDGKEYTGEELRQEFNNTFNSYVDSKKDSLYRQLEVDQDGKPTEKTIESLRNLLKDEAVKRGYPKQDVDALEITPRLNSKGEVVDMQFTLPLWMSPNSNRYESLLNSIVTNRLVNIKLPGRSFVVGSEAGFKFKSDLEGIDSSKVIYNSNFNGTLANNQILLPSTFKDDKGKFIDLTSSKYSIRDENGILRLKEDMIDNDLLSITSFRIPTSGHVSMSQMEIAGFLPPEVGDLMVVPKNLIKQKGLDFDIDKETTYKLWTRVMPDGKIKAISEEDRQDFIGFLEDKLAKQKSYEDTADDLFSAIFQDNPNFIKGVYTDDTLNLEQKVDRITSEFDQKVLENKIVKIHSAVLGNQNTEVQQKINKTLSIDFAKSQAQLISNITATDDKLFTILDDTYQKDKMYLGASGKLGIGVYSNYVVFNSMVQQLDNDISIRTVDEDGNPANIDLQIGKIKSDGKLGRQQSLGKSPRALSEVFAERQNTATDNEKEQIMGRVNVNEVTINVDSLLSALGFDKDVLSNGKEVSVPYLLLSQPIIKDYVEQIRKSKSSTATFDPDVKAKIISLLKEKYKVGQEFNPKEVRKLLTGDELFYNLSNPTNSIQLSVLDLFTELDNYATVLGQLQRRLNINNSGLGKSFFDTIEKYYGVQNIKVANEFNTNGVIIENASKLVGDFIKIKEDTTEERVQELVDDGYLKMSEYLIKPSTPVGSMLVNVSKSGYDLWEKYFPYDEDNIKASINEILSSTTNEDTSTQRKVDLQQQVFKEMKKYFVSSSKLGLFTGSPQQERSRLFIDTKDNQSLSAYLREILSDNSSPLKSNKLISRFEFAINTDGLPSLIKFDNSKGENFDEDYLYNSLIELMSGSLTLPDYNGQPYTTRQLAQDLIIYSYLEGGIQEAIQFSKYIPVNYLNSIDFAENTREWSYRPGIFAKILGDKFVNQYFQHNPERLPKLEKSNLLNIKYSGKEELGNIIYFEENEDTLSNSQLLKLSDSDYVAIYNPQIKKGLNKFQVYRRSGYGWDRISSLGVFGMSEYSIRDNNVKSLVNPNFTNNKEVESIDQEVVVREDIFNIQGGNLKEIIDNISDFKFEQFKFLEDVVTSLKDYIPSGVKVEVRDILDSSGNRIAKGSYKDNVISIDTKYYNEASNEAIARTIIKETIHALTYDYMKTHVNSDGSYKTSNPPREIINLVVLFNEVKRKLGSELESFSGLPKTPREKNVVYAGTSIYEFVEVAMTEPDFQKEMKNLTYKSSNKSIFEKFSEIIDAILKKVLGESYSKNSVTYGAINNTLQIIENQAKTQEVNSPFKSMQQTDIEAENLLNDSNIDYSKFIEENPDTLLEPIGNFEIFLDKLEKKNC